jgi:hypothetical protein
MRLEKAGRTITYKGQCGKKDKGRIQKKDSGAAGGKLDPAPTEGMSVQGKKGMTMRVVSWGLATPEVQLQCSFSQWPFQLAASKMRPLRAYVFPCMKTLLLALVLLPLLSVLADPIAIG